MKRVVGVVTTVLACITCVTAVAVVAVVIYYSKFSWTHWPETLNRSGQPVPLSLLSGSTSSQRPAGTPHCLNIYFCSLTTGAGFRDVNDVLTPHSPVTACYILVK